MRLGQESGTRPEVVTTDLRRRNCLGRGHVGVADDGKHVAERLHRTQCARREIEWCPTSAGDQRWRDAPYSVLPAAPCTFSTQTSRVGSAADRAPGQRGLPLPCLVPSRDDGRLLTRRGNSGDDGAEREDDPAEPAPHSLLLQAGARATRREAVGPFSIARSGLPRPARRRADAFAGDPPVGGRRVSRGACSRPMQRSGEGRN